MGHTQLYRGTSVTGVAFLGAKKVKEQLKIIKGFARENQKIFPVVEQDNKPKERDLSNKPE